jgi:UDP-N-acetylglucosamine 2-epimerase
MVMRNIHKNTLKEHGLTDSDFLEAGDGSKALDLAKGTNELAGSNTELIVEYANKILDNNWKTGNIPELWDGKTSERILDVLTKLTT